MQSSIHYSWGEYGKIRGNDDPHWPIMRFPGTRLQTNRNLKHQTFGFEVSWRFMAVQGASSLELQGMSPATIILVNLLHRSLYKFQLYTANRISIYDLYASQNLLCKLDSSPPRLELTASVLWFCTLDPAGWALPTANCYQRTSTRRQLVSRRRRHQCPSRPRSS